MISFIENLGFSDLMLVLVAILLLIEFVPKLKKQWDDFHKETGWSKTSDIKEEEQNDKLEELETRLNQLEEKVDRTATQFFENQQLFHGQSIEVRSELANDIKSLTELFENYLEMDKKRTIASFRNSLWSMHRMFMDQGFVTPDGLKTFLEMGKIYEHAGGNDVYHDKLKPEVESLDIHYPSGGIIN